jgi:hypothetical protein
MIFISEILPNPIGKDADGEFIEIFNNGNADVSLSGYKLSDASGKSFYFKNTILKSGEYFVVKYSDSKISLNNDGDSVFLYNDSGVLIDKIEYKGKVEEGISIARNSASDSGTKTSSSTPGLPNKYVSSENNSINVNKTNSIVGVRDNNNFVSITKTDITSAVILGISISIILSVVFVILFRRIRK